MAASKKVEFLDPPLPYSKDAEVAVLGAILLENQMVEDVAFLREREFFLQQHQIIFRLMNALHENNEAIDLVTLTEKLYSDGKLEEAGGAVYIAQLADGMPRGSNIVHYANIIRRKAMLRRVIEIGDLAQRLAFEGSTDSAEAITDQVLQGFMDLATDYAGTKLAGKTSREGELSLLYNLENQESTLRINTGLTKLDKQTGGFRAGELITVTASVTGSGKTLFAQQIKRTACKAGFHGMYFSGEMPVEQLLARELATEAGVPHWKLRRPENLSHEDYAALIHFASTDCEICRVIDGDFSIRDVRIALRRMKRSGKLSWAVLDYDELIEAPGKDEFAQQRYVIREAKRLATALAIPVIVISGIRKPPDAKEAKKPRLEQIYGSGAKSKHSSFVLFVDREYVRELKGDQTKARICILKARDGKTGEVKAVFNVQTLRFEDFVEAIETHEAGDPE